MTAFSLSVSPFSLAVVLCCIAWGLFVVLLLLSRGAVMNAREQRDDALASLALAQSKTDLEVQVGKVWESVATALGEELKAVPATHLEDVRQMMEVFGQDMPGMIAQPDPETVALRMVLLTEEFSETMAAASTGDMVELLDGLLDMLVIIYGTALTYGLPLQDGWAEVHRSNMAKVDLDTGLVLYREDGKVLKPEGWEGPRLHEVLEAYGWEQARPVELEPREPLALEELPEQDWGMDAYWDDDDMAA